MNTDATTYSISHKISTICTRYCCDLFSLRWRHNELDGVSDHQPHGCELNRLFRRWSKKTSKLRVTGLCVGNSPVPVNSPHKGPVTRNMLPFDDVIMYYNTFRSKQSGRYFPDDIYKCIFLNENACILIKISLKLVPIGPIENKSALVEAMAWRRTGDKPLSEPMMVQFPYAYMRHSASMSQLTLYRWLRARLQYLQWVSSLALSHRCYVSYCGLFLNFEIVIDLNQILYTLI